MFRCPIEVLSPVVSFCETVEGASGIKGCGETEDKKSKISMIAEPLNKGLAEDIENGVVSTKWSRQRRAEFLHAKYGWGMREACSIWAFGPDERGPNMLLDGTVKGEVDRNLLEAMKDFIVQGFLWAAKEGPLCAEPMRSVKFKIVVAKFEPGVLPADIICATRRAACTAFLMATPRLMEPIYSAEIQALKSNESLINSTLGCRAKNIACHAVEVSTVEHKKFTIYKALIPVRACFGLEDDLGIIQSSLSCQLVFNHWELVAGDEAKLIKEIGHQKGKDMNIREYVNEDMPTKEGADAELYTLGWERTS